MKFNFCPAVRLATSFLLLFSVGVLAQQPPSAGSQLLQIPAVRAQPAASAAVPSSAVNSPATSALEDTNSVKLTRLRFVGANAVSETLLVRLSGFVPGQHYTLSGLRELAARVTTYYRSLGYFLAQTYVPAQDITDGVVQFSVVEGRYGTIKVNNQSSMSNQVANNLLEPLKGASAVMASDLERRLLLLSDLPGIQVKSVLAPGTQAGTTDLMVDINEGRVAGGSLDSDNHGNSFTGANRFGANVYWNQPTGLGDLGTLRFLTSGAGMSYGQASYQAQVAGITWGLSHAELHYRLSGEFASIQSSGTARVSSLFLNYPLIRSRDSNLVLQASVDNKQFSDQTGIALLETRTEKSLQLVAGTIRGDFRDAWGPASNDYAVTWTHGTVDLRDPVARDVDLLSAQSQGAFDKLNFSVGRLQNVTSGSQLYARLSGQWASKNLDASEKFSLGGANQVRAFPSGEATGDEGFLFTLESRSNVPFLTETFSGKWQFIAFLDAGLIRVNKHAWEVETADLQRNLQGTGLGVTYAGTDNLMIKAYYATKLGSETASSESDTPGRFWLQLNKPF